MSLVPDNHSNSETVFTELSQRINDLYTKIDLQASKIDALFEKLDVVIDRLEQKIDRNHEELITLLSQTEEERVKNRLIRMKIPSPFFPHFTFRHVGSE